MATQVIIMAKEDDSNEDFSFPTPVSDEFYPPPPPPPHFLEFPPAWWRSSAASRRENQLTKKEEEKMDMLWEDFNCNEEHNNYSKRDSNNGDDHGELLKLEFVECLRLSSKPIIKRPTGGGGGKVVFMKVLRKVFLLHHSSHTYFKN